MNKKIVIGGVIGANLIILASFTSAVGYYSVQSSEEKTVYSPLFTIRKNQALERDNAQVTMNYLGRNRNMPIFFPIRIPTNERLNQALKLIQTNPELLDDVLGKITAVPEMQQLLDQHNVDLAEFEMKMNALARDPEQLKETMEESLQSLSLTNEPIPLGLSTSNALGCFIAVIALLPVFLALGVIIATATIVTCLNIGNCFETLMQNLLDSLLQGLRP